ncbi:hypothetical protein DWX41_18345 [Hungatella hathewayi]|uniref:Uncharacterized protein n=1 Tax=Hungatella hathewayi TaxID=154046 RepID=A0A3E2WJI7_9FIRM|nr:hypothetical protein [Faecalicatena contorta]RGC27228.1 hypothetical protein DWX41_18345 [Hungatella hathewayi]
MQDIFRAEISCILYKWGLPMKKRLKDYFPQIRTREEVMNDIRISPVSAYQFDQWRRNFRKNSWISAPEPGVLK